MKTIHVVAAIIHDDEGRIFATQRGYGDWKGWWEFPGGKIEPGENSQDAIRREIREELNCEIAVGELLTTVEYDYPNFHLSMQCFMCTLSSGEPQLLEHEDARWLRREDLDSVKWLPADKGIITLLKKLIMKYNREFTPEFITELNTNEIFVFGSNIRGFHGGGAARVANKKFGAEWGVGEGLTGQCYALPTMEGGVDYIAGKVQNFLNCAKSHPEFKFYVTKIACGIAGFKVEEIGPLFADAISMENVILPKEFVEEIEKGF